ncbi:hypothetical protein KDL01_42875, partial [Actinospica durhamensis]
QLPTRDPHVGTCQFTRPLTLHDSILAQPLRGRARTEIFIGLLGSVGESDYLLMLSGCGFRPVAGGAVELGHGAW